MGQSKLSVNKLGSNAVHSIEDVCQLMHERTGVVLGERQRAMVESRLQKRTGELNLNSLPEYLEYFSANSSSELEALTSLLTTHYTFFFREFGQFEFLAQKMLPDMISRARAEKRKIRLWSAASSTGQEVYSLAMWMKYQLSLVQNAPDFEIFGTDIDAESVAFSKRGVYRWKELQQSPMHLLKGLWARGTGDIAEFVKAKDSLVKYCRFASHNLLHPFPSSFGHYDAVFCRNVFIYFTPEQVTQISRRLFEHVYPGGALFLGASESLRSGNLQAKYLGSSIYQKALPAESQTSVPAATPAARAQVTPEPTPATASPIRVLVVDDSPTIHRLLEKILTPEAGFFISGFAKSGLEASSFLQRETVDLITLDIHMPDQDGLTYLKENFKPGHPPVVMLSSVSREDSELSGQALKLGATDFVEKPAFGNLAERTDEIRSKLKMASQVRRPSGASDLDASFGVKRKEFANPDRHLVVLALHSSEASKAVSMLYGLKSQMTASVPTLVVFTDAPASLPSVGSPPTVSVPESGWPKGSLVVKGFGEAEKALQRLRGLERVAFVVSERAAKEPNALSKPIGSTASYFLEEGTRGLSLAHWGGQTFQDRTPLTSMPYIVERFLCRQ